MRVNESNKTIKFSKATAIENSGLIEPYRAPNGLRKMKSNKGHLLRAVTSFLKWCPRKLNRRHGFKNMKEFMEFWSTTESVGRHRSSSLNQIHIFPMIFDSTSSYLGTFPFELKDIMRLMFLLSYRLPFPVTMEYESNSFVGLLVLPL